MVIDILKIRFETDKKNLYIFSILFILNIAAFVFINIYFTKNYFLKNKTIQIQTEIYKKNEKYTLTRQKIKNFRSKIPYYKKIIPKIPLSKDKVLNYISSDENIKIINLQYKKQKKSDFIELNLNTMSKNKNDTDIIKFLVKLKQHFIYTIQPKNFYLNYGIAQVTLKYFTADEKDIKLFEKIIKIYKDKNETR